MDKLLLSVVNLLVIEFSSAQELTLFSDESTNSIFSA